MKPLLNLTGRGVGIGFRKYAGIKTLAHCAGAFRNKERLILKWLTVPDINITVGETWTLELSDYIISGEDVTYTVETGELPAGIELKANGSFSGTDLKSGAGSVSFLATAAPSGDTSESNLIDWTTEDA